MGDKKEGEEQGQGMYFAGSLPAKSNGLTVFLSPRSQLEVLETTLPLTLGGRRHSAIRPPVLDLRFPTPCGFPLKPCPQDHIVPLLPKLNIPSVSYLNPHRYRW